jgi:hypothetical protein
MHWLDPDYLPKTVGVLDRFVLNPRADIDGLLLTDGTEIHTPPHLSSQLLTALAPGAKLTVHGVKPRRGSGIVAVAIDPAKGERIVDEGPVHKHDKPEKPSHRPERHGESVMHSGVIQHLLHGPKGRPHGALLVDGVVVRFPPHSAESFAHLLVVDAPLSARGTSITTAQGTVIDAEALGKDQLTLKAATKHPEPAPKKPKKGPASRDHDQHS